RDRNLISSLERQDAAFKSSGKTEKALKYGGRIGHRLERVRSAAVLLHHPIEQVFLFFLCPAPVDGPFFLPADFVHAISSQEVARPQGCLRPPDCIQTGLSLSQAEH